MNGARTRDLVFVPGQLLGITLLFLPFVEGYSPIGVLVDNGPGSWPFIVIVCLASVSIPILTSTVRQAAVGPPTKWEVRAMHMLALVALAVTVFLMLYLIDEGGGSSVEGAAIIPSTIILAVGAAVVLAATRKGRVPRQVHAHVAMLVAWMPNAAFCLSFFGSEGGWGAGFYLAIVTLVAYAVEATLRVRAALRSEGEAGAEAR
jgi:hypothetical protein